MYEDIIIPRDSVLYSSFQKLSTEQHIVFFAGLPGVGKSLLLQQLALMAHEAGRVVHLLQWDVTRAKFETDEVLARYPEIDGVTHAAIRKAVGLWSRQGVQTWYEQYAAKDKRHLLVGEVPLIGNRLIELVQKRNDVVESLLASPQSTFVLPVLEREANEWYHAGAEES